MPNVTTWRCLACRCELGTATGPTLALARLEGLRALATPSGLVVTCPRCRMDRLWTWRPRRAA